MRHFVEVTDEEYEVLKAITNGDYKKGPAEVDIDTFLRLKGFESQGIHAFCGPRHMYSFKKGHVTVTVDEIGK